MVKMVSETEYLKMRKFFIKKNAIKKQKLLEKKGIKTKIVKTTKINKLFPKSEQKRTAYKVVRMI